MLAALLLSSSSLFLAQEQPPSLPRFEAEIVLRRRARLAFLPVSPGGAEARVRTSAVIRLVSELFEAHTDFTVEVVESERVAECKGRLACLVRRVRTDYDRNRLLDEDGRALPFAAHREALATSKTDVASALFVLSNIASGRRDRLIPTWVDTDAALEVVHQSGLRARDDSDLEADVRRAAVPVRLRGVTVETREEAATFLENVVTQQLRPTLETSQHWRPFAELHLLDAPDGAAVLFDGETIGTTRQGAVRLRQVPAGRHKIMISPAEGPPWATEFEAGIGETLTLTVGRPSTGGLRTIPKVVFWTGLGLAAAGVATAVAGAVTAPDSATVYCAPPCMDRFAGLGESFDETVVGVESPAVLTVPLGYSLALTGATWSIGTQLIEPEANFPWLSVVSGLVLGGAAYGLSAALGGG